MKINGFDDKKIEIKKKEEIVKSGHLNHLTFNASMYPDEYRYITFALKERKTKQQIKDQFIKEVEKHVNLAKDVKEKINKIDAEELVTLNYFEVFDISLKNVYKTVSKTHDVYNTIGVEVKTTTSSDGSVSSTTTPIKEYSHSYTSSKDELLYRKYHSNFSSVTAHEFLQIGKMYSLPKEVNLEDLVANEKVNDLSILRIEQPSPSAVSIYEFYNKSLESIKDNHNRHIRAVVQHSLQNASYIEKITINKIILHPIWKVEFEYTLNGKKEKFISFISDCDNSFTSSEYLDIPLVKKEISQVHSTLSIIYTIFMGFSLLIGIISLWRAFKTFTPLISLPYIISYAILLYLTINVGIVGFRSENTKPIQYTYFKNRLPKMYVKMVIGIAVFVILLMFGIDILFNFI